MSLAATGTAVIFRDSFTQGMIPFLAPAFSRCVFVWNPFVDYDLVSQENPVLVLNVMAERFLPVVPDDVKEGLNNSAAAGDNSAPDWGDDRCS